MSGIPGNLRIGTSSWSSADWVGPFYPEGTAPADYLRHYATVYDTVEVDATFYRIPTARMVDGWRDKTPEGFVFAAKMPRVVTHDKELVDCAEEASAFFEVMARLGDRLGPILLQFAYFSKKRDAKEYETGAGFRERLDEFLDRVPEGVRIAVEVRNEKWIAPPLLETLQRKNAALVLVDYYTMPPIDRLLAKTDPLTSDLLYARFLGHHRKMDGIVAKKAEERGDDRKWDSLAVDRTREMSCWVPALARLCPRVENAFVYVNNHYAGYAPGSIDLLRSLLEAGPG